MTDGVSTTDSDLFPELRSNVLNGPVFSLWYTEVDIDNETQLDDHEDDEDVGAHQILKS